MLEQLQTRLFDFTKRNRMLYFKPVNRFLNLTYLSFVQQKLNNAVPEGKFFTANPHICRLIGNGKNIDITDLFVDYSASYCNEIADQIRLQSNRDEFEYGFSSMRLVLAFLRWFDPLDEEAGEIVSPLILVPAKIIKKRGIPVRYEIDFEEEEATINPFLRQLFRQRFNISLPEDIFISENTINELFVLLQQEINLKCPSVHLSLQQEVNEDHLNRIRTEWKIWNKNFKYEPEEPNQPDDLYIPDVVNKNNWIIDASYCVIGNFNFRKMSLLRDYDALRENNLTNPVFNQLFQSLPQRAFHKQIRGTYFSDQFQVVPADPTQSKAIFQAAGGESYVIQGPPGTGKSQTITNLIADLSARGKKILFVCGKRAALDVVFYRLKQQQLDQICCLIHDSQKDKKAFIEQLKQTYHTALSYKTELSQIETNRAILVSGINQSIHQLEEFFFAMRTSHKESGWPVYKIIERLIELKPDTKLWPDINEKEWPAYKYWIDYGEWLEKTGDVIQQLQGEKIIANHPVTNLHRRFFEDETAFTQLSSLIQEATSHLQQLITINNQLPLNDERLKNWHHLKQLHSDFFGIQELVMHGNISLLDDRSEAYQKLNESAKRFSVLLKNIKSIETENKNWKTKPDANETKIALQQMEKFQRSFFRFLNPSWYRLKKQIQGNYDFNAHRIKPPIIDVLKNLEQEYNLIAQKEIIEEESKTDFQASDPQELNLKIKKWKKQIEQSWGKDFLSHQHLEALWKLLQSWNETDRKLSNTLHNYRSLSVSELETRLHEIEKSRHHFSDLLPYLKKLFEAPVLLTDAVRNEQLFYQDWEASMAYKSLQEFYRQNRHLMEIESEVIRFLLEKINKEYALLLKINADYVLAKQADTIKRIVAKSEQTLAGLSKEQKEERKKILEARRILENEFGKTRRFKSIRELADHETEELVFKLKSVWLMSPLSVSDTLPIEADLFDVVIYDEASQITLEEGVPPLFRAKQAIIVGDEMQMPPTNFFNSQNFVGEAFDDEIQIEDSEDESQDREAEMELQVNWQESESILNLAARQIPGILLGWHYRSQSESLISFSNAAFYRDQLLTIPDRFHWESGENQSTGKYNNVEQMLSVPISFHFQQGAIYHNRVNQAEADYIADLVIRCLKDKPDMSIGVVAFSLEQQGKIEKALHKQAEQNPFIDQLLEDAYRRTENDQFVGLFIKNLENVQGDERDLIVMSICYGYNREGKMRMNFGPVNRRGGEKRLNVIFSRAKKHVAVVSSIRGNDITNEKNIGANHLKKYLQYAELVAQRKMKDAMAVIRSIYPERKSKTTQSAIVAAEIAERLRQEGFMVEEQTGQSFFKFNLAVIRPDKPNEFVLGILVDDEQHYSGSMIENYFHRPQTMRQFGWNVLQVWNKDWLRNKEQVVQKILTQLK